jgi:hypothetical protein
MINQMTTKDIFTHIYRQNTWGSEGSRSGPASSFQRTAEIREGLPVLLQRLEIQSVLDCGCGDWNWMKTVFPIAGIQYIGADIVDPLVTTCQEQFTADTVVFQQLDILQDPPETADLWLARDFCSVLKFQQILKFFQKFLESQSKYLAVTSIDTQKQNTDSVPGNMRALNMRADPFNLPSPVATVEDGQQWFCKKQLLVYGKQQILEWYALTASTFEGSQQSTTTDKRGRNAHLVSNVSLRDVKLHGHMGSSMPSRASEDSLK